MVAALLFHKYRFIGLLSVSKQWRTLPSADYVYTSNTITYPIAFANAVWAIIATPNGDYSEESVYSQFSVESKDKTKCILKNCRGGTTPGGYIIVCGY